MGYPGRHNIYEATIRRMVTQALEAQEMQFRQDHALDTDAQLLDLVRDWVSVHGYTPWPLEIPGGSYMAERFGSWEALMDLAGLEPPPHPNRQQSFQRFREETDRQKAIYRRKKAEKKQLTQKRLTQQAAKRKAHETR
jgi:hypothetical protein